MLPYMLPGIVYQARKAVIDPASTPFKSSLLLLPSTPPGASLDFHGARGSAFPLFKLVDLHRSLLTHALALPAGQFFAKKNH